MELNSITHLVTGHMIYLFFRENLHHDHHDYEPIGCLYLYIVVAVCNINIANILLSVFVCLRFL